jgi:hypothetical protein
MPRHAAVLGFFVLFAVGWTWPLAAHLSTHLPGAGPGDNLTNLWNFWWMRTALASGDGPFHTSALMAPLGVDLATNTHTAFTAFIGATLLAAVSPAAALNLTIIAGLALSGFSASLLAWHLTRDRAASLLAGVVFAGAPFTAAHLNGHFNLVTTWTIPLFALSVVMALSRRSMAYAAAAGLLLGLTAYIDYYFVVYLSVLGCVLAALNAWHVRVRITAPTPARRRLMWMFAGLAMADAALIVLVLTTGGFRFEAGGVRISARSLFNPLQAFWLLATAWLWCRYGPRFTVAATETRGAAFRAMAVMGAAAVVVAAPLAWQAFGLLARGDYVTQQYLWRSAPKGIDAGTFLAGNPFHPVWGATVRAAYEARRIDIIESCGWLGIVPPLLAVFAVRRRWAEPAVRQWTAIGAVFLVWALGSHLYVLGINTGMILPQTLLRYVPIVSNARMPGRALIVATLALAVLSAFALAAFRAGRSPLRSAGVAAALTLLVAVDYLPAPFPLLALDRPAIYDVLKQQADAGSLCELPMGVRDGFGVRGLLDERVLGYQAIHGRPITGGFVARMPAGTLAAYEDDPLLSALLRLSAGAGSDAGPVPDRQGAGEMLRSHGIRFVMLNRATAPAGLVEYVERVLPLTVVAVDGSRTLYRVAP